MTFCQTTVRRLPRGCLFAICLCSLISLCCFTVLTGPLAIESMASSNQIFQTRPPVSRTQWMNECVECRIVVVPISIDAALYQFSRRILSVRVRYWTTLLSITLYRSVHAYAHELDVAKYDSAAQLIRRFKILELSL
jgi:hypothetical protein